MILVRAGAGFIGANFVLDWLALHDEPIVNLDVLTYAGNLENLASIMTRAICSSKEASRTMNLIEELLRSHRPRTILNLAAVPAAP
jgi:dTDP-glucose 4,6-dehydratase